MKNCNYKDNDIAIIGMSGKVSEANDLDEFWLNLISGQESIREFPQSRRKELEKIIPQINDMDFSRAGYLDNILLFEPEIFGLSHEESKYIDPQHRLLLELVEEAILDSGYNPKQLSGKKVGVFLGENGVNYIERIVDSSSPMKFVNSVASSNAGRIAYTYNFCGPALTFGSACSSSLVAIHYACQNLSLGEADFAIAGASELSLFPEEKKSIDKQSVMSIEQKVRAFDRDADGTASGEGGGIVVLKLLKRALEDGDNIHAIIKGSAVNSNGSRSNGIAAPSEKGQADVILDAIQKSQIESRSISYIETHGTGTKVGDPIEVLGISRALDSLNYKRQSVAITSLKTNIGHLDSASGIAGLIKTTLMLKNKIIPATLNFDNPNPLINFISSPVYVNNAMKEWNAQGVRRAGVTSLGLIGTNCHIILEEAPFAEDQETVISKNIVFLSARTEKSLELMIEKLNKYLSHNRHLSINSISYTLNAGRRRYDYQFVAVVNSVNELIEKLTMCIKDSGVTGRAYKKFKTVEKNDFSIAYVIPDLEHQNFSQENELYKAYHSYKEAFDECAKEIENVTDLNNPKILYLLHSYSYSKLFAKYSIKEKAVLGIGIGDLIADFIMGRKSFKKTLKEVREYNEEKRNIEEAKLSNLVDKMKNSGINTFVMLFPPKDLYNLFSKVLMRQEDVLLLNFQNTQKSFYMQIISLMEKGMCFEWEKIYENENRKRISLPGYVFNRMSYFIEAEELIQNKHSSTYINGKQEYNLGTEVINTKSIKDTLYEVFNEIYHGESFSLDSDIYDLNLDSLSIMQFAAKVKKIYNIDVPIEAILKGMSIGDIFNNLEKLINGTSDSTLSIEKQPEKQLYPVSSAQKRVFILNELINDNTSYNMPMAIIIKGKLEVEVIEKAFKELVKRHEALRTSFEFKDKELMQHIHKDIEFNMKYLEIQEDNIDEMIKNFVKPFDLGKGPLLRACLARLSENKYLLLYDMHHIISDGTSINILMQELFDLYKGKRLDNLRIQYKDFSVWQNEFFKSEDIKKQEDYWLQAFSGEIPTLNMPTDYKRMPLQSFEGDKITFELETYLADKVDELVKETKTTMYMVFLAIYNTLLYKYTGQECIIIGSPISGRKHSDLEKVIGMFVNTLPMMNYPTGDKTFMEFLEEVRENTSKAYENQDYQFDELVEKLHLNRDLSRNPLFDTMFSFANQNEKEKNSVYNIEFSEYEFSNSVAKFDLDLNCTKGKTGIKFDFEYCTKLYRRETIESMTNYFVNIIKKVVDNPYIKLRDIDMLSIEEKDKILFKFNNTKSVYDKELTVYQLFENQAKKTPDNIALVFENQQISYKDLNAKANQVARILVKNGVKREDIVGIMAKRSIEMIIAIMGILKTGAAYLPIDPEYPNDRITYILEDSGSKMLLTQKELFNKISFDGEKISLDDSDIWEEDNSNLNIINNSSSLAYVIYTSGSTGKPKGVMIKHRAVNNFIQGITERIEFIEGKTILALTTICFDIFLLETILPLVKGLKVIIANENEQIESNALAKVISKGIDMLQITPSRLKILISNERNAQCLDSLTDIMIGGEPLPHGILEELQKKIKARIYNMYGPTETTVWSTLSDLSKSATIHIGKPISNTQVYILDKNNSVLPINVVGELCISGDGLARGYLNRNELNLEKFVDNPFATTENMICKRMYKTGDLAKWLPDGNIQIIGRIDHQLKIRGYRIEPGEIEKVILKYEDIKEAVVIDYEDKNETKYLCAYIVSIKNEHTISKLREYLTKELPEYMIPSYFIQLDKIPLTYNGKVDRKLLPAPDGIINLSNEYIAPRNDLEEKLTKLWSDVLDVNKLGIDDNFFELGGHSLKAAMLISRIDNDLNVQIPLGELFKNPTIRHLANYIQNKNVHEYKAISKANKREYYPIPSPLKTILKYEHETGSKGIYNKTEILIVQGDLDKDRLEKAIRALIKRHEILRTAFEIIDGEPIQKVYEYDDVVFKIDNIKETQGKLDDIVADYVKPFDLSKPPLIRVGLMELEQQKYALLFDMHQAITDGTSTNILIKEIKDLYEGKDLSPETIQYKDYSIWYSEFHKSDEVQKKREFWLDLFSGKIPLLDFPTDYERHGIEDYRAERIVFKLNKELTHSLNKLAYEYNATLYMVLLSAYYIMLNHNTKQEDIVVGTPIAARPHIDLQNMMGLFANNITMRNYPRKDMTFLEFLKEVKTNALKAFENQEYEFEQIIDELQLDTPPNRNPLFDTMFALHNIHNEEFEIDNLKLIPHDIKFWAIKYDFVLHANEVDEEIHFDFRYRTALFKDDTMKKVVEEYILIIQNIIDNPEFKLGEIKI